MTKTSKKLSKQAEIPSSCGKGQWPHMEQKSEKKIQPFFWQFFFEVSVFTALTVEYCPMHMF
jgi:hypothetical protein